MCSSLIVRNLAPLVLGVACLGALTNLAAAETTYTQQIGREGGTPFEVTCPAKQFLVGIDYRSTATVKAIAGFCKEYDTNGKSVGKLFGTNGYGGDVTSGTSRPPLYCRQDQVITKIGVGLDQNGLVRFVNMTCSPTTGTNTGIIMGKTVADGKGPALVSSVGATDDCRFGVGFVGAASGSVYRIGLVCRPMDIAQAALPVDNGNGDNGGGGGAQGTAPGGTTVYRQPNGDDSQANIVGYVDAGGTVSIAGCNANNWCQVSSPLKGWVWGDDINR